jgi:hypothetical protein
MLKHLYKSHVRESLSPHQDKIQFSKSPNHYPNNTEVQLVYKSLSFGGWLYYTIFKLDTISHPYHSNCAFQSLLWRTSNFVINHEDLLVDSNLWLIHQWLTKMVTKHTDLCFFLLFDSGLWNPKFRNLYLEFFDVVSHWFSAHLLLRLQYKTT